MSKALTGRKGQLREDQHDAIWERWLRRESSTAIASAIGCAPATVKSSIKKTRRSLYERRCEDLEQLRSESLAEWDNLKRTAWQRLAGCKDFSSSAVGYLSVISDARRQQDKILGLEQNRVTVDHRIVALQRIEQIMNTPVPPHLPGEQALLEHQPQESQEEADEH